LDPISASVVVPTFNRLAHLKQTIRALEKQHLEPDAFEVIVVDDGSTDGTAAYLKNYSGPLNLHPLILTSNMGRPSARNRGAERAAGDVLILIDGDVRFGTGFIDGHLAHHRGSKAVVVGRVIYGREKRGRGYARYLETRGAVKLKAGASVPGRYFLSGNASIPSGLFRRMGGFDERFVVYGEDIDFGMRLESAGVKLKFDPHLKVEHLHLRSIDAALDLAGRYGESSVPMLLEKHPTLHSQLKLDWLEGSGILRWMRRLLLSEPVFRLLKGAVKCLDRFAAPAFLYDYLLFRSYFKGYEKSRTRRAY